jgi:hypothetical protein
MPLSVPSSVSRTCPICSLVKTRRTDRISRSRCHKHGRLRAICLVVRPSKVVPRSARTEPRHPSGILGDAVCTYRGRPASARIRMLTGTRRVVARAANVTQACTGGSSSMVPYPFAGYGVPSRWVYPPPSAIMSISGYVQRSWGSELPISSTWAGRPDLFTR